MKICKKCGTQFPDNMSFCSKCGGPLTNYGDVYCSKCGAKNTSMDSFCKNCGSPLGGGQPSPNKQYSSIPNNGNGGGYPAPSGSGNKNIVLIVVVIILAVVLAVIVGSLVSFKSSKQTLSDKAGVESQDGSGDATSGDTLSLSEYQSYYDGIDDSFGGFIVSSSKKGELKTYKQSLEDALKNKNLENCKYNYDQLNDLKDSIESDSKDKINSLKNKINKYEKKSKCKKAKKGTEYKKNKKLAQAAADKGDYVDAKTYYEACLDTLKKASKKKAKTVSSGRTLSGNDTWYQTGASDSDTYNAVYYNYLDANYVAGFSAEQKRYYMNTLFAAYGYRFNNSTIQSFFDHQSWYTPDYSIGVGDQTSIRSKFDDICSYNYSLLSGNR